MTDERCDLLIVGGGVIGASVAYHLAAHRGSVGHIVVLERDLTLSRAASALSAGSIRQQFTSPVNIRISLHGIDFLRRVGATLAVDGDAPAISLHEGGYLYLASAAGADGLAANVAVQRSEGADVAFLDPMALAARFPWLSLDAIAAGSLGLSGEGWFDGYALTRAFNRKARALGADVRQATVSEIEASKARVTGVRLADGTRITCGGLVLAAGAATRGLLAPLGIRLPVFAKTRNVFPFTCRTPVTPSPLIIDPSGVWWRPEGEGFIAGYSPNDLDATDQNLEMVDWPLWEGVIWPALAARVPAFEAVKVGRAWCGPYDMNLFDANALVGRFEPFANLFGAVGFSGHGLQQSPAVGCGLAELIVEGAYRSLDLSDLSPARLVQGRALREQNVI